MSNVENRFSRSLLVALADLPDGTYLSNSEQLRDALSALEYLIPTVIGEIHPEMAGQALDGVLPAVTRKTGDREIEMLGHVNFITDQTLTPFHLRLQLSLSGEEISWLELRLGERVENSMRRTPYGSEAATGRLLLALEKRKAAIDWFYEVTFGDRR